MGSAPRLTLFSLTILFVFCLGYAIGVKKNAIFLVLNNYSSRISLLFEEEKPEVNFGSFSLPKLEVLLTDESKKTLDDRLHQAVHKNDGWLLTELDQPDYLDATLKFESHFIPIKVRLKGNSDNKAGINYRLRVKTKSGLFRNIKSFNLQPALIKNGEDEWLFHSMAKEIGLFPLDYFFAELTLNDTTELYAIEEHFYVDLLTNKGLDTGIVVCYKEAHETLSYNHKQSFSPKMVSPSFFISKIEPYYKGVVKKNALLSAYFRHAHSLLSRFRTGDLPTSAVFDTKKLAQLFVLCDLLGTIHPLEYRNMKFYYNSSTKKLEPIPYDLHVGVQVLNNGNAFELKEKSHFLNLLFNDSIFYREYIQLLERYSGTNISRYFKTSIAKLDSIKAIMKLCARPAHITNKNHFDIIAKNQELLNRKLNPFRVATCFYTSSLNDTTHLIRVENTHTLPIVVHSTKCKTGKTVLINKRIEGSIIGRPVSSSIISVNGYRQDLHALNISLFGTDSIRATKIEGVDYLY